MFPCAIIWRVRAAFVVVEVSEGREAARSLRTRGTGACGNHATFVEMLNGCDAVICGGIGQGAAVSLAANGIAALVSPAAVGTPVEDALARVDRRPPGDLGRSRLSV